MKRKLYAYTTKWYYEGRLESGKIPWIKVGDTTQKTAEERIKQQDNESNPEILKKIGEWEIPMSFRDHDIHKILEQRGIERKRDGQRVPGVGSVGRREWFECDTDSIDSAVNELLTGSHRPENYQTRQEQSEAVNKAFNYFVENWGGSDTEKFLFNCKMRFGKTFTSYELMRKLQEHYENDFKVLVLTYKPSVREEWHKGLDRHVNFDGWTFVSAYDNKQTTIEVPAGNSVVFASFQDILGKKCNGKPKKRWTQVLKNHFDLVILDEVHYGTRTDNALALLAQISHDLELHLSGTPIKILMSNEFMSEQIYTWDYVDEQVMKQKMYRTDMWGQYRVLPVMKMYGYQIGQMVRNEAEFYTDDEGFTFTKFLAANKETHELEHPSDVEAFLNLLASKNGRRFLSPFKNDQIPFEEIKNSFWRVPDVASAKALGRMLMKHPFFQKFGIVIAAGDNDGWGTDTLKLVHRKLSEANCGETVGTIIISCGKLDTGVTLPSLGAVFMLSDTKSPEVYMQTIFRCQSTDWDEEVGGIKKKACHVFDFNPNRMLELLYTYSEHMAPEDSDTGEYLRTLIDVLSVQIYEDNEFREVNTSEIIRAATNVETSIDRFTSSYNLHPECVTDELFMLLRSAREAKDVKKADTITNDELANGKNHIIERESKLREIDPAEIKNIKKKLLGIKMALPHFMAETDEIISSVNDIYKTKDSELFEDRAGLAPSAFKILVNAGCFNKNKLNLDISAYALGLTDAVMM